MNNEQLLRYSRHILLPQLDVQGQEKLLAAKVLVVGLGGLGSPVAMYLAASGIGHLVLNDFDEVEASNLQRQVVHTTQSIGLSKVASAKNNLESLNADCNITALDKNLSSEGLLEQVNNIDVVIDCSDNFATRSLLNKVCVQTQTPLVSGAAIRFEGQVTVFHNQTNDDACYACLYPDLNNSDLKNNAEEPETCSESGVLSPLVGVIGSMQAVEVIKVIAGIGETLRNRLLLYDGLAQDVRVIKYKKDPECRACNN